MLFVVFFVGLIKVVAAFVFVVCWVVVSFAPHGKKIKPRPKAGHWVYFCLFNNVWHAT